MEADEVSGTVAGVINKRLVYSPFRKMVVVLKDILLNRFRMGTNFTFKHTPVRLVLVISLLVGMITGAFGQSRTVRSEEHTSELQSREKLVCRLLLEKKKPS